MPGVSRGPTLDAACRKRSVTRGAVCTAGTEMRSSSLTEHHTGSRRTAAHATPARVCMRTARLSHPGEVKEKANGMGTKQPLVSVPFGNIVSGQGGCPDRRVIHSSWAPDRESASVFRLETHLPGPSMFEQKYCIWEKGHPICSQTEMTTYCHLPGTGGRTGQRLRYPHFSGGLKAL